MSDDDPLEHADVGETIHIERERVAPLDPPLVYRGTDRHATPEITALEVTDDNELRVVWEADVIKTLPRNWDYCRDPLTDEEEQRERRKTWVRRGLTAAGFFIPVAIGTGVAAFLTSKLDGALTINEEPFTATTTELIGPTVLVFIMAAIIFWGVHGGSPGRVGGARR